MVIEIYMFSIATLQGFCHTSHLTLALVGLLQMIKGFGGVFGAEAAVKTSRASEFILFYNKTCSNTYMQQCIIICKVQFLVLQNFDELKLTDKKVDKCPSNNESSKLCTAKIAIYGITYSSVILTHY